MTYLEAINEMQRRSIEAIKAAQSTQLASLAASRDIAAAAARTPPLAVPPLVSAMSKLTTSFTFALLEQQVAYAKKLTDSLVTIAKPSTPGAAIAPSSAPDHRAIESRAGEVTLAQTAVAETPAPGALAAAPIVRDAEAAAGKYTDVTKRIVAAEPIATAEPAIATAASIAASEPLAVVAPIAASEPLAVEPVTTAEPIAAADPVAAPEPFAAAEPVTTAEPIAAADPVAASEPIAIVEPATTAEPMAAPQPAGSAPTDAALTSKRSAEPIADGNSRTAATSGSDLPPDDAGDSTDGAVFAGKVAPVDAAISGEVASSAAPAGTTQAERPAPKTRNAKIVDQTVTLAALDQSQNEILSKTLPAPKAPAMSANAARKTQKLPTVSNKRSPKTGPKES